MHSQETKTAGPRGKIAFSSYINGSWQIWTMTPYGSELSLLTSAPQDLHHPAWSPDGNRLTYADNQGNILIMDVGHPPQRLPNLPQNCSDPAWSPDGNALAFVCYVFKERREDSDIWIATLDPGRVWKLLEQEGIQKQPAWSSDGSAIVYTTGHRINSDKIIEELWLVNHDGTEARRLLSNNASNIQPDWSPDGKKIVFASDKSGNMDIWVMDRYGGQLTQLTQDGALDMDPSWSTDGSQICFVSTRSGRMDLWIMPGDGKNPEQLSGDSISPAESKDPDWSP